MNTAKTKIPLFLLDVVVQCVFVTSAVGMFCFVCFVLSIRGVLTINFAVWAKEHQTVFLWFLALDFPVLIALLNLFRLGNTIISGRVVDNRIVLEPPYILGRKLFRIWRLQNLTLVTLVLCLFAIAIVFVDPLARPHALVHSFPGLWKLI